MAGNDLGSQFASKIGIAAMESQLEILKLLNGIIESMDRATDSHGFDGNGLNSEKEAYKVMSKHLNKGGTLRSDTLSVEDSKMFEELLKFWHVPYICTTIENPVTLEKSCVFTTRDIDKKFVDQARDRMLEEMQVGIKELTIAEMNQKNDGKELFVHKGLDMIELEVFRHNIAKFDDVEYAVGLDPKTNRANIYFHPRDVKDVNNALKMTAYDLSGKVGYEYGKKIRANLDEINRFKDEVTPKGDETLYVLDLQNPNTFISVNSDHFVMHNMREVADKSTGLSHIEDKKTTVGYTNDMQSLLNQTEGLMSPVILTEEEMKPLIQGLSNDETAIPTYDDPEMFTKMLQQVQRDCLGLEDLIYDGESFNKEAFIDDEIQDLKSIELSQAEASKVKEQLRTMGSQSKNFSIQNSLTHGTSVLIFAKAHENQANDLLTKAEVYQNDNALDLAQSRMKHEGRGELDVRNENKTYYLVDASTPDYTMKIDKNGLDIMHNDQVINHTDRTDANFEKAVANICVPNHSDNKALTQCKTANIIVLTPEEYLSQQRADIVKSKDPSLKHKDLKVASLGDRLTRRLKKAQHEFEKKTVANSNAKKPVFHIVKSYEFLDSRDDVKAVKLTPEAMHKAEQKFKNEQTDTHRIALVGDTMAFAGADKEICADFLAQTIYNTTDASSLTEARILHEGRGVLDMHSLDKEQFIVNLDMPDYILRLDRSGLDIMHDGKISHHIDRSDKLFESTINDVCVIKHKDKPLAQCPTANVVVLTGAEFRSLDRDDIISERNPENQNGHAKSLVFNEESMERAQFEKMAVTPDMRELVNSERQRNAVDRMSRWHLGNDKEPARVIANAKTQKFVEHPSNKIEGATYVKERNMLSSKTDVVTDHGSERSSRTVNTSHNYSDISH